MAVNVLLLTGFGINAEKELGWAFEIAGGKVDIIHIEDVIEDKSMLDSYQIIGFPGGFSFGDHMGSGRVFANLVKSNFIDEIKRFIEKDKLIIGICNGFQIITKLGLVPDLDENFEQSVALVENDSAKYEDRWVWLKKDNDKSPWLHGINRIYLPVRHGEGKLVTADQKVLERIKSSGSVALRYCAPDGAEPVYPYNPNGAVDNIAGLINKKGNVFGLMPHPEAYISRQNHPRWTEHIDNNEPMGLEIFKNGIKYFK